ncbi:MAG: hypothetical protein E6K10_01890 [Methanobacteriota archaeon]|nr:MAG: hypothetical protein E6K10_01890 [Euryarchaeota archaeon]
MTEVIFLTSVQAEQDRRVQSISEKVRQRIPGIDVKVLSGASNRDLMAKHKIQFGPAVIVDGRLEYVGIPRLRPHRRGRTPIPADSAQRSYRPPAFSFSEKLVIVLGDAA